MQQIRPNSGDSRVTVSLTPSSHHYGTAPAILGDVEKKISKHSNALPTPSYAAIPDKRKPSTPSCTPAVQPRETTTSKYQPPFFVKRATLSPGTDSKTVYS